MDKDDKEDIPLREFKSPIPNEDELEDEESTAYNSIKSQETNNNEKKNDSSGDNLNQFASESDYENEQVSRPLLEQTNINNNSNNDGIMMQNLNRIERTSDLGPATLAETESLMQPNEIQETNVDDVQPQPNDEINVLKRDKGLLYNCLKPTPLKIAYLLGILGLLFLTVFLPTCIFRLEYNQLGVAESKLSGKLSDIAYGPGFHFLLPWNRWIYFDKTVHAIEFYELSIFTTDKLQVKVSFKLYYFLNQKTLVEFYRKFGMEYHKMLQSVCKSELQNIGLKFSIDDYRANRLVVRKYLKESLRKKLENEFLVTFFELFLDKIKFTKEINRLNLLRMLNGIYNEKANYEKQNNLTIAETKYKVQILKNKAREILETSKLTANNTIIRKEEINFETKMEMVHLKGFENSLYALNFFSSRRPVQSKNDSQRALSFCYLASLINNDKIKIINQDKRTPNNQFSSRLDGLVGLISL